MNLILNIYFLISIIVFLSSSILYFSPNIFFYDYDEIENINLCHKIYLLKSNIIYISIFIFLISTVLFKYYLIDCSSNFIFKSNYYIVVALSTFNDSIMLVSSIFLFALLISIFISDIFFMIIPEEYIFAIFIISLPNFINGNFPTLFFNFISGFLPFAILIAISTLIYKKAVIGAGDIKLMTALGMFLGYQKILSTYFMTFFFNSIFIITFFIIKITLYFLLYLTNSKQIYNLSNLYNYIRNIKNIPLVPFILLGVSLNLYI